MTQDVLRPENSELDWGPERRLGAAPLEKARTYVSNATLHDVGPMIAIVLGATILAIGGLLVWTSLTASAAAGNASTAMPAALAQAPSPGVSTPPESAGSTGALGDALDGGKDGSVPDVVTPAVIVHVSGHVHRPGIVEVPSTARVVHAVEAAGGALGDADLDRINLAAVVVDGSQIYVPPHQVADVQPNDQTASTQPAALQSSTGDLARSTAAKMDQPPEGPPPPVAPSANPADTLDGQEPSTSAVSPVPESAPQPSAQPSSTQPSVPDLPEGLPAEPILDHHTLYDRDTAPTPEELLAALEAQGIGLSPELVAELLNLDTAPTPEELDALFQKHGLANDAPADP